MYIFEISQQSVPAMYIYTYVYSVYTHNIDTTIL